MTERVFADIIVPFWHGQVHVAVPCKCLRCLIHFLLSYRPCMSGGMLMFCSRYLEECLDRNVIHLLNDLVRLDEITSNSSVDKGGQSNLQELILVGSLESGYLPNGPTLDVLDRVLLLF